jgi:hypothetical protein
MTGNDFKTAGGSDVVHRRLGRPIVDIRHGSAVDAADVLMMLDIAVEPGLTPAALQPLDHARLRKLVEIPIDRPEADAGHPPADDIEQVRRGGMGGEAAEFLEDQLPLSGVSLRGCDDGFFRLILLIINKSSEMSNRR